MKSTTIILPTYCPDVQVSEYLIECVNRLCESSIRRIADFVVVEQGREQLASKNLAEWSDGLYVWSKQPLGYARAVNLGVSLAKTEFICVLNNDLFVPDGWLGMLLSEFASIPNCGVLAPFDGLVARLDPSGKIRENEGWWSCVLMRREHFNSLGGLDDGLLNYRFHDQDFNIKTHLAGLTVARTGKVIVEHIDSATYSRMPERVNADVAEKAEMVRRWNADSYYGWLANGAGK